MSADGDMNSVKDTRSKRILRRRVDFLNEVLAPERKLRIADVGANPVNRPNYADLLELGACEVWGFEPDESAFAELLESPQPGAHYIQQAVGRTGPGKFHCHPVVPLGSIYPIRKESVAYLGHPRWYKPDAPIMDVELRSLDDIDELPRVDVLKMDIQGSELDVIQTGKDKLSEAIAIIPEVRFYRMYEEEPMFGTLDCEMHDQGFALHKFEFTKSKIVGNSQRKKMWYPAFRTQLIDGDAVYIRNPETMSDWTDEQVKNLALASAAVFFSLDLTVYCLDEMVRRKLVDENVPERFLSVLPRWLFKDG